MLRQHSAIALTTHGIKTVTEKNKTLNWEDFGPEAIPQLEEHTAKAARDVWWTWPEAIAWAGSQDYRNIAVLRHWGNILKLEAGHRLGGQEIIAKSFCTSPQQIEASLLEAIETGAIKSSGRSKPEASSELLEPGIWRGGAIIFSHGTACLVSKLDIWSAPWAYDLAVHRANLVAFTATGKADPATSNVTDAVPRLTANAERECKDWLYSAFTEDAEMKRSKKSFQEEAISIFSGRLSVRSFIRAWDSLAPQSGRSRPGRKGGKS
jgi:hypothetical protein